MYFLIKISSAAADPNNRWWNHMEACFCPGFIHLVILHSLIVCSWSQRCTRTCICICMTTCMSRCICMRPCLYFYTYISSHPLAPAIPPPWVISRELGGAPATRSSGIASTQPQTKSFKFVGDSAPIRALRRLPYQIRTPSWRSHCWGKISTASLMHMLHRPAGLTIESIAATLY